MFHKTDVSHSASNTDLLERQSAAPCLCLKQQVTEHSVTFHKPISETKETCDSARVSQEVLESSPPQGWGRYWIKR